MNKQQAIKDMIEYIDKHYLKYKYTPSLRDIEAELGQIVAALDENNQSTLKRLVFDAKKERPVLHAENKRYKDICPQQIVIQGVAVKVIKDLL